MTAVTGLPGATGSRPARPAVTAAPSLPGATGSRPARPAVTAGADSRLAHSWNPESPQPSPDKYKQIYRKFTKK